MERRNFVKTAGLLAAAAYIRPDISGSFQTNSAVLQIAGITEKEFPALPYAYNALEPYIDARTMEIHYDKHHRTYHTNLLNAVKGTSLEGVTLSEIFASMSKHPEPVRNNGGGYFNHLFFWKNLQTGSAGPGKPLLDAIIKSFGTIEKFKESFTNAAKSRFGSGWAWLYVNSEKNLAIGSTPNQDNPLMDLSTIKGTPLLTLDVWEHAYYLKYQNKRADYIDAFWNVVNWEEVGKRYEQSLNA